MIALRLAEGLGLGRLANRALGLVLPPRCLACGETVHETGTLCARCWQGIVFLAPPCCAICGFPFEFDPGPGALCGACTAAPPAFARARAVLRYTDASRGLILAFKHGDRTDAAPAYARWMVRAGEALVEEADIVAPVPLHRLRLLARRYNQSALLAQAIGRLAAKRVIADLLLRTRNTPSQGAMNATERRRNVAGAFALRPRRVDAIAGRRVLLIDDVLTTGATLAASAGALLRGGAAAVDVLTLARVVRAS